MHGFYANLLTKNISMGGNVENAVSVFTAGSSRQNHVVSSEDVNSAPISSGVEESSSSSSSLRRDVETVNHTSIAGIDTAKTAAVSDINKKPDGPKAVPPSQPAVVAPEPKKTEDINSARERYLARKRKLQEEAGGV